MAIDPRKVLRLNLPQWQGGDRPNYRIGGRVLAAIAPEPQGPEETVPVLVVGKDERPVDGGIVSRHALLEQLVAVRSAIDRHAPEAIVTLGGDCHVDLAPIAYLSERYGDDLAVLWVDAHPDICVHQRADMPTRMCSRYSWVKAIPSSWPRCVGQWIQGASSMSA